MVRAAAPGVFLCLLLAGCSAGHPFSHEETVEKTFATKAKPRVIVETFNGPVDVKVDGQALLLAKVIKKGTGITQEAAREDCGNIEVMFTEEQDNTYRIVAKRTNGWQGRSGATVELVVPEQAELELKSSNGSIEVVGPAADLKARTSNGPITTKGGKGRRELYSSNGRIEVEADAAELKLDTSNGRIRFVGSLLAGEHLLDSSNGSITVILPATATFKVDASTSNGSIKSEFELSESSRAKRTRLIGSVGTNPTAELKIKTSNSSIDIEKAP